MTFERAKQILSKATRSELRDHAFGDREVYWSNVEEEIAYGYFSKDSKFVSVMNVCDEGGTDFEGVQAEELVKLGIVGTIERNDETGPEEYQDGKIMPKLTKEYVRKEIEG